MKTVLLILVLVSSASISRAVTSPNGQLKLDVTLGKSGLSYSVNNGDATVIERSPIVFTLDGKDIFGAASLAGDKQTYSVDEKYAWRGPHSQARNHCNGVKTPLKSGNLSLTVELRAYDDAVAYRIIVAGDESAARVPDERSVFTLPAKTTIWTHDLSGHYEGAYTKRDVGELRKREWAGPPVTFKLKDGTYGAITEAALVNYSGMALQANGERGLVVGLGHRQPVNHPFELRYKKADIERLSKPAVVKGTITTPWRVIMVAKDLNGLVNCDIVANISPPPDQKLFPQGVNSYWVKPGRAVWRYLDSARGGEGDRSLEQMKEFDEGAKALGFEYNVIEGLWRRFTDDEIRDLVSFGNQRGIKHLVWVASWDQRDPEKRRALFKRCHDLGIAGLKIDFFDHEHKEMIDLYHDILRDAAEQHLLLIFHGANKPAGEERTWPNEMNREAVKGMESSRMWHRAEHETTLPFTRWLAGPADYTPVHLGDRRADTTWAHQIASGAILSAPILTYAANPQHLLANPAVEMIKSIPAVWDQTIVLKDSEIGECAAYARRKDETWFLAIMNGPEPRSVDVPLGFLDDVEYQTLIVRDARTVPKTRSATKPSTGPATADPATAAVDVEKTTSRQDQRLKIDLPAGGGFIARFSHSK